MTVYMAAGQREPLQDKSLTGGVSNEKKERKTKGLVI